MRPVDDIFNLPKWDQGSLTPPYLTPVGTSFRPKYWACANRTTLEKSLQHVIACLENVGFTWLESLQDSAFFAAQADPVATLPYSFENEAAGRFERARAGYEDTIGRLRTILTTFDAKMVPERDILEKYAKPFIFVSAKIGVEHERARYFRQKLNYHPDILPLP